jgi:hypothetical protein
MTDARTFPAALDAERATKSGPPPQAEVPHVSPWPARGGSVASALQRTLARPKVRLTVLGIALLLLAAFVVTGSAWTAPLAVVGILALVVAWFGSRLDGRLMLEWDESGVTFEFKADINAPRQPPQHIDSLAVTRRLDAVADAPPFIESTATTVEIDVEELKALIALAEAA